MAVSLEIISTMEKTRKILRKSQEFHFQNGKSISQFELAYDTYGKLNKAMSNCILVCHAFSGSHHAAGKFDNDEKNGWWDEFIGDGKTIDTNKYFVVSVNNFGSCFGSSGPKSICPETKKPYGIDFPDVTVLDWVKSQKILMDELKIPHWEMVAGGSLGGMQALQWAISYPDIVKKACVIAATAQSSPQNIALNEVAREMIKKDENFHDGNYFEKNAIPKVGLMTARMLGHITYLSENNMQKRFGRKKQNPESKVETDVIYEIENYLRYKGDKFSEIFDANTYILMTKAMDEFNICGDNENDFQLILKKIKAKLLIISFESDWLFPSWHSKFIQKNAMKVGISSSYIELEGSYGHDSFLFASDEYCNIVENFLNFNDG